MSVKPGAAATTAAVSTASWLPLIVVVLTQIQASFAVNALTVSMAGITTDLDTPATSVGTAITAGTFAMAAFILLGAKIGARYGTRLVFQIAVAIHGLAMAVVALSQSPAMLFVAQAASGAVIALIAPALTVFIATNFSGDQQAKAIGYLAAAIPAAGVLALLIAGSFATTIGWRYSFALVVALAVGQPDPELPGQTCSPAEGHHHRLGRRRHCCRCRHPAQLRFQRPELVGRHPGHRRCAVLGHRCFTPRPS